MHIYIPYKQLCLPIKVEQPAVRTSIGSFTIYLLNLFSFLTYFFEVSFLVWAFALFFDRRCLIKAGVLSPLFRYVWHLYVRTSVCSVRPSGSVCQTLILVVINKYEKATNIEPWTIFIESIHDVRKWQTLRRIRRDERRKRNTIEHLI